MHMSEIAKAREYVDVLEELRSDLARFQQRKYIQDCILGFGRQLKAHNGKLSHTRYEVLSPETRAAMAALVEVDYNTRIAALEEALEALGVDTD